MNTPLSCAQWFTWFFNKQHFYKQRQAKIGKKSTKCKQHPEAELSLFENNSHSLSRYHPKIIGKERKRTNKK